LPYVVLALTHGLTAAVFLLDRSPGTNAAVTGLPLDDAWIHLVYARSLAGFDGFSYNPGLPEAGFTSPLWAIALAPCFWLQDLVGMNVVACAKILGVAVAWGCSVVAFRLLRRLTGSTATAYLGGLLIALDPALSFAKLSGMEVPFAAFTVLLCLEAFASRRTVLAGILLALAPLARPENALFAAVGVLLLTLRLRETRARLRRWVAALAPLPLAAIWWVGHCLSVSGRPLPNTYYIKSIGSSEVVVENFATIFGSMLFDLPWFRHGIGLLLFVVGARVLLRTKTETGGRSWVAALLVAHPILYLAGVARTHTLPQWWPFYWSRYFEPAIPFLLMVVAVGAIAILRWSHAGLALSLGRKIGGALAMFVVALPLLSYPRVLLMKSELFAWNVQNVNEMNVTLGHWLRENTKPDEWIAATDAGAIRFFSDRNVIDLVGLNNSTVATQGLRAELHARRPRIYAVFGSWLPDITAVGRFRVLHGVRAPVYTICDCDQEEIVVVERTR
jgi:hypothetical protein